MANKKAQNLIAVRDALKAKRATWDTLWQDIADYVMPRKSQVNTEKTEDVDDFTDEIHDTEAIHANITLAAGQLDYLVNGKWFDFEPPHRQEDSSAARYWYKKASETCLEVIQESNFDLEVHEFFLDRGGFGTAHLHCEEDPDDVLFFTSADLGQFSITENHKGIPDTCYTDFKMTAEAAARKFGKENLGPVLTKTLNSDDPTDKYKEHKFIHAVYPQYAGDRDPRKMDRENMAFKSCYISIDDQDFVRESGYFEQPMAVSRYLKWQDNSVYGYCPAVEVLPAIRQANFIESQLDALAELMVWPRILTPSSMEKRVDLRAGGETFFNENEPNAKPEEWATAGRYDVGVERVRMKHDMTRRAFHVDLFQLLTNLDELRREKTAFEVQQMMTEKLTRFSPTFSRIKVEVFPILLNRVFGICYRKGLFGRPPQEVIREGAMGLSIPTPKIRYTSKLAMALKSVENQHFMQFMEMSREMREIDPGAWERVVNVDRTFITMADNQGVSTEFLNNEQERQAVQEKQQSQAEAEAQMAAIQGAASAAKDMGGAPQMMQDEMANLPPI